MDKATKQYNVAQNQVIKSDAQSYKKYKDVMIHMQSTAWAAVVAIVF